MHLDIIAIVFAVIFIAELPDKSMFASVLLSTRFRAWYVWLGVSAAFLVHVVIAAAAGRLLTLLPHETLEIIVSLLFLGGGLLLLFGKHGVEEEKPGALQDKNVHSFRKVFTTSFAIVFIGEWGDITQIMTANYAAKYHDPWSVGVGAALGLLAVAGLGIAMGDRLLKKLPAKLIMRIAGLIFIGFALYTGLSLLR